MTEVNIIMCRDCKKIHIMEVKEQYNSEIIYSSNNHYRKNCCESENSMSMGGYVCYLKIIMVPLL